jgi:hypothetical protein
MSYKRKADAIWKFIEEYREVGNPWPATARQISEWALSTGRYQPREKSKESLATREFANAMRLLSFQDPQGRNVRQYHAVKLSELEIRELDIDGMEQLVLWVDVATDDPQKVKIAFQQEREGILDDCIRLRTEVDSYNENYSVGEQLLLDLDFNEDVAEAQEPVVYQG